MRELYFENQGIYTYLVYEIKDNDIVDSMSLGMITNNKIQGLAQTLFTQVDNKKYIKFNVSSKVSAFQIFSGAVNKKHLLGVFKGIVNALLVAEEYMLAPELMILDTNYIFVDVSTCEAVLLCLPIEQSEPSKVDIGIFLRNIMFTTQFAQNENCDYVAQIINFLNGHPQFSLMDFKNVLEELEDKKVPQGCVRESEQAVTDTTVVQQKGVIQPTISQNYSSVNISNSVLPFAGAEDVEKKGFVQQQGQVMQHQEKIKEQEISFFYLMQHYNKQNAAVYKAQKEARKQSKEKKNGKKSEVKRTASATNNTVDLGFAIPGQAAPAPTPTFIQSAQASVQQVHQPTSMSQAQPVLQPQVRMTVETPQFSSVQQGAQGQQLNFGDTTVLRVGGIGETTVLRAAQNVNQTLVPHLIRAKNGEKILIDKPVFRIGKEKSYVDYFMGDNTAISRSHANIVRREDEFFVMDTNSTNHTFLNGNMLQSMVEVKIKHGDTIRLSNEDFEFKLY